MEQQMLNNQSFSNASDEALQTSQALENLIFTVRVIENENQILVTKFEESKFKNEDVNSNDLRVASESLMFRLKSIIQEIKLVQADVFNNHLLAWKINQKFIANGAVINSSITLDGIQMWCETLASILCSLQALLQDMINYYQPFPIPGLMSIDCLCKLVQPVTVLLENLIISSFVVERQPPQVIMTNKKFTSSVRFLIGNALNMNMTRPNVSVKLVSQGQAERIQETNQCGESCGEIMNDKGVMEYNETTRRLSLTFNNLSLNITKADRRRECQKEKVVDKKFALLFQSTIPIGNSSHSYSIWTFSLPVVITVHVSQEPNAWATILWDNAFSDFNRKPFAVPEKVLWNRLGQALNMKFRSLTGRYLTNDNLRFIFEKIMRINVSVPNHDNYEITWTQFTKDHLPGCSFTFWDWFYDIMKLTRMHLRGPWSDGLIIGFINRRIAEQYLACCQRGTFLLRFSETELGSITISLVDMEYNIIHLQPFSFDDLKMRSLADCIRDFDWITHLYPNHSKAEVFGKYMSARQTGVKPPYVQRGIRATILQDVNFSNNMI